MQCTNVSSESRVLLQLQNRFQTLMDNLNSDPKIAEFMNTSLGKFFNSHPFFALSSLVFGALATVPVVLFLVFAMVTFIFAAVGFVLLEVFLLTLGGATLLCTLCGVAIVATAVSLTLSAIYVTTSYMLNLYYSQRYQASEEKRDPTKILGPKNQGGQ